MTPLMTLPLASTLFLILVITSGCGSSAVRIFSVPGSSPSFGGGTLYEDSVINVEEAGRVIRLDTSGNGLWKTDLAGPLTEPATLLGKTLLVLSSSGRWYGLDADSGQIKWAKDDMPPPALPAEVAQGLFVVMAFDAKIHALDPATGDEKWAYAMAGSPTEDANFCVGSGTIFGWRGSGQTFTIDSRTGRFLWRRKASPLGCVVTQDIIVTQDRNGKVEGINAKNSTVLWARDIGPPAPRTLVSDAQGSRVWLGKSDASVLALETRTGKTVRQFFLSSALAAPVTFTHEYVFAPAQGRQGCLYFGAIDSALGWIRPKTEICVNHALRGNPLVVDDVLFLTPRDGRVIGYRLKELSKN